MTNVRLAGATDRLASACHGPYGDLIMVPRVLGRGSAAMTMDLCAHLIDQNFSGCDSSIGWPDRFLVLRMAS
jgi:hypothetical protein